MSVYLGKKGKKGKKERSKKKAYKTGLNWTIPHLK